MTEERRTTPISPELIRAAIAEMLDLEPATVTPDRDLIELGLDSIRMMRLAGRWRKAGHRVDFATLAAAPTVAAWAELLAATSETSSTTSEPAASQQPIGTHPMTDPGDPSADAPGGPDTLNPADSTADPTAVGPALVAPAAVGATMFARSEGNPIAAESPADQAANTERFGGGNPAHTAANSPANPTAITETFAEGGGNPATAAHTAANSPADPAAITETPADVGNPATADRTAAETADSAAPGTPFPLAPMQHAYWIGRESTHDLGGVAAHLYVEFDGAGLDSERLAQAVAGLVAAHPMLRTRFLPDGTQQTLPVPARPSFAVVDLTADPDPETALEALRQRKTHQILDIAAGQVLDVTLTRLPGGRNRLHVDVDMIAGDAMSYRTMIAELAHRYQGTPVTPPAYTYRQYRTEVAAEPAVREQDRAWWQQRLDGLPGAPELPTVPVAERGPVRSIRHHHWIEPAAKARLLEAAHAHGVTPAVALAAVFAETIGGWSAGSRFLLNLPLFQRESVHPDIDRVIGDFSSSIMLDVDVTDTVTVIERARALQRTLHECAAHSGYAGLDVLRDLGRLRGEPVLAPVVYTSALNLGELFAAEVGTTFGEPVWIISQGPQVLLDAQVTEVRGGLLLNWDVRADAFPAGMIEAMFARYTHAVTQLAAGEAAWDAESAVHLPVSQATVRAAVNATDMLFSNRLLHQGLFERAAVEPAATAVCWTDDNGTARQWSYGELVHSALTVAGGLRAAGIRPGGTVAIQLPKGPDQVLAVFGVLAAGATYLPVGYDQPAARRDVILADGDATLTITDLPGSTAHTVALDTLRAWPDPLPEPVFGDPEAAAYVLFTSGSTGKPKGVAVPHRAAMNTLDAVNDRFEVGPGDRSLMVSALEFDPTVYDMFGLLSAGGAVVTLTPAQRAEPTAWTAAVATHRVTVLTCVPAVLDMMLDADRGELGTLRAALLGGDWVGAELARRAARQIPGCRFAGLGGATETAIHSTVCEVSEPPAHWVTVPWGVPLPNVRCRVAGPAGRDCPDWVPGELWVGGRNVALGYRNDPQRTAERFVDHDGIRWYRTGDLARYRPDGTLEFLGRADHQVQLRGYRIELGEVETSLRSAPGVRHAIAAVVGGVTPRLVAAVAGTAGEPEIWAAAAELLPGYMMPAQLVVLDRMPLTANGKLDRRAVAGLLDGAGAAESSPGRAPADDLEAALAHLAGEVLGREPIGVEDDFFTLGGDSVQATTMTARIRELLDVGHALVGDLFAARTVAALAERLAARDSRERLVAIGALYLEVAAMSDADVLAG
ncbi:non-ribosomal peptide synthetase [Nocardia stercoris]|uniref:Phenyloxazoline synthase MbtB n=1 Tax=Nocardia stercoris TaxID=2483361 RepID=A0A3M2L1F5_9NOCA|nr:non-ribosomal peptide synthetase [Nocardia stercoris]RMI28378.1 amino acid adenylation domain-containing protein [Nocardia stercoris]